MHDDTRRAFGEDRLEAGGDGEVWLHCPAPKAWLARRPKTLTTAEYPGTAVEWQGGVFEVLRTEPQADGSIRYRLAPWEEAHAIRRMERYDAASEVARGAEQLDRRERIRRRRLSILFAPLVGLLPGETQKRMEGEFGAPAVAMTIASALPLAVAGFLGLFDHLLRSVGGGLGLPEVLTPPFPVAIYLCMESALRLASAVAAGEPMGALPVVVAAMAWREARAPGSGSRGRSRPLPDAERDALDRFRMLEPMLSLLAPEEQRTIARRFPFDPIRWGRITSWALLIVGVVEAGASLVSLFVGRLGIADAAWLLAGGFLALEQVRRLRILRSGSPAGSVLGVLVRPLARPLFSARPVGG
jgi:hypothetical protein